MTREPVRIGLGSAARSFRALVSFEAMLVLYLFWGNYKVDPRLAWLPFDLSIGFFVLGVAMGAIIIWRERLYLPGLAVVAAAGVFVAWAAITYLWTPSTAYAGQKLIRLMAFNLWCVIGSAMIIANRTERVRRFLLLLLAFATVASVDGIIQYATTENFALSAKFRLENYLGQGRLYGLGVLVAFALWLQSPPFSRRGTVLIAAIATCGFGMLIAGGRGPLVSVVGAMLLPLVLGLRFADRRLFASKSLLASLVLFAVMAAVLVHLAMVSADNLRAFQRFNTLLSAQGGGSSVADRLELWPATLRFWAETPVFGQGIGGWPVLHYGLDVGWHPHNLIAEVLVEFGLIGFIVLAVVVAIACSRVTLERLRTEPALMIAAMLCIGTFFFTMTSGDLTDNRALFAMIGLMAMRPAGAATHAGPVSRPPHRSASVRSGFSGAIPDPRSVDYYDGRAPGSRHRCEGAVALRLMQGYDRVRLRRRPDDW